MSGSGLQTYGPLVLHLLVAAILAGLILLFDFVAAAVVTSNRAEDLIRHGVFTPGTVEALHRGGFLNDDSNRQQWPIPNVLGVSR